MLKTSYLELLTKITALAVFKHIDMYAGQYLNEADGEELPFPVPAIFIEFTDIPTQELGELAQEGEAIIRFHIVSDVVVNEVSNSTNPAIRSNALNHLNLIDEFHAHISKFSGTHFNALSRTDVSADTNPSDIFVHIVSYMARFTDVSAVKTYRPVTPTINIDSALNS